MFKLAHYLRHYKKEVILGPLCKLLEAIFELFIPLLMTQIIDVGIKNHDITYVYQRGFLMIGLGGIGFLFALICQYVASKASQGIGTMLRNDLFAHVNTLSHAELDLLSSASLVNRLTNDINQLELAVAMLIRLVIRAPFLIIGATIMALLIHVQMALIFLAAGVAVSVILFVIMKYSMPLYRLVQKKLDQLGRLTIENLQGARVIRGFARQDTQKQQFDQAAAAHTQSALQAAHLSALLNPLSTVVMNVAVLAIIWFGALNVQNGSLAQGQIVALVNYIMQILLALIVLANLIVLFTRASASAARVNQVFALQSTVQSSPDIVPPDTSCPDTPAIQMQDVCFTYANSKQSAISDISFAVYPGQTVGIIGATGSGKSTIVNLIPRFYDAVQGTIQIGGTDVRTYPLDQLRNTIGIVPQHSMLFHGSILDNLRWGCEHATLQQVEWALSIAQAQEFVDRLPDGINTMISENAKNLSGGQKQRLCIARALIRRPQILILDDSSSALDFATDLSLRQTIRRKAENMTVVVVSQRVPSVRSADLILVLDHGRIVAQGTHETLHQRCDIYREICVSQQIGS